MSIPNITWAQNDKIIYLNILLESNDSTEINIYDNKINLKHDDYNFELEFNQELIVNECNIKKNRIIELDLKKKERKFWIHLLKDKNLYKSFIKIDWNRWEDEDDDNDLLDISSDSEFSNDEDNNSDTSDENIINQE